MSKVALVAVSRRGMELAIRLKQSLPEADIHLPERLVRDSKEGIFVWNGHLKAQISELFSRYRGLVVFGSVGMAVRLVAPSIQDKRTDSAVVVVDDGGRFAVSLLSGHLGGANALAGRVAGLLGATPVITTASDVLGFPSVDLLGREHGWRLEKEENVARVSAALIDGEPVGVLQEAGESSWWPAGRPLPQNLVRFSSREGLAGSACVAGLVITDRSVADWEEMWPPVVVYRPRSLVVGIGCHHETPVERIAKAVESALDSGGLVISSVRALATVDQKRDEGGLQQLADRLGVPLLSYSSRELSQVAPNPSEMALRWIGSAGVCEPAALLGAGAKSLLVPKFKTTGITVAIARVMSSSQ